MVVLCRGEASKQASERAEVRTVTRLGLARLQHSHGLAASAVTANADTSTTTKQASNPPKELKHRTKNDQDFRPSLSTIYNTYTHTHTLSLIATYVTGVRSTRTSRTFPGPDREDAVNYNSYNKYILISLRFGVSEVINI